MIIKRINKSAGFSFASIVALSLFFSPFLNFFSAVSVQADTRRYIIPSSEIAIRTGQGTEYKIIAVVKDGTSVELLEEDESYAKVRLIDGKEGWIIKRFLSVDIPLRELVDSLQEENEGIKRRELEAIYNLEDLSFKLTQSETELNAILAERDQIQKDYVKLQQDTADIVQMKKDYLKISQENKLLERNLISVNSNYERLKDDNAMNWFLAGSGVLLVGIIFGRILAKSRKRKPSLL